MPQQSFWHTWYILQSFITTEFPRYIDCSKICMD